ncbi:MAG: hypothetical protein LUQ70_04480 [Methanobacteriaceae archaeon]|nr:hypothetical protein [Methanobacteriaceae archaeon]
MVLENLKSFQEEMEKSILTLKPIKVGKKEIYPLVKVTEINLNSFHARSIEPIALLVVENDEKYLISFDEKEPSPELLNLVSI